MFLISSEKYEIRSTSDKGRGVFITEVLPPGIIIGDYIGTVMTSADADRLEGVYGMWRNEHETIWADKDAPGIHLVNHSCVPNCGFFPYNGHVLMTSLRKVFPGEELTASYMVDPLVDNEQDDYLPCFCGSKLCRGTMRTTADLSEKFTNFMQTEQDKNPQKLCTRFGETLPLLPDYPASIEDHDIFDLYGKEDGTPAQFDDSSMPDAGVLRQRIRQTGVTLAFPQMHLEVLGVAQGILVARTF